MTVRQLAKMLHEMPPDAQILVYSRMDEGGDRGRTAKYYADVTKADEEHYFKGDGWGIMFDITGPVVVIK